MQVVRKESIYISNSESDTFLKMTYLLEGIAKECNNPIYKQKANNALKGILEVWNIIEEIQEDSND